MTPEERIEIARGIYTDPPLTILKQKTKTKLTKRCTVCKWRRTAGTLCKVCISKMETQ